MTKIVGLLFLSTNILYAQFTNYGFENGTSNWSGDTFLTISENTSIYHAGLKGLTCTFISEDQNGCDLRSDLINGLTGGTDYTFSAWFFDNDAAGRARIAVEWYDATNAFTSTTYATYYTVDAYAWQELSQIITSPVNAAGCKIGVRFYDIAGSWDGDCTIYVDDFAVSPEPVPIELIDFASTIESEGVVLRWSTATEANNYGFEVERKVIGEPSSGWDKIGFVAGAGTSTAPHEYCFCDNDVSPGSYSYRLKQIDLDGAFKYYPEEQVEILGPTVFALGPNYPNPFNPTTTIRYSLPQRSQVLLTVFNPVGQQVATLVQGEKEAGHHEVELDGAGLSSGVYFYRLQAGDFVQTRKLLLLK